MDDAEFGGYGGEEGELAPREPSVEDLIHLCRELNASGCRYLVVGGFAMIGAGYSRRTMDIDLVVDASLENEEKVYRVLETLPDQAVKPKSGNGCFAQSHEDTKRMRVHICCG